MDDTQNLLKILLATGERHETEINFIWNQVVETGLQSKFIEMALQENSNTVINYLLKYNALSTSTIWELLDKSNSLDANTAKIRYLAIMAAGKNMSLGLKNAILKKILLHNPDGFSLNTISALLKKNRGQFSEIQLKTIFDYIIKYAKVPPQNKLNTSGID